MTKITDSYLWMENLQHPKLKKWVSERNKATKRQLENISKKLRPRIEHYYMIPYVLLVRTSNRGHFILLRDGQSFKIRIIAPDGFVNNLINSRELGRDVVLQWLYASKEGKRCAFSYSFGGSDEGITRIMDTDSKEVLDELKGRIGDITWLDNERYYYGRFYSKEKTPDGIDPPAERIFLRENGKDKLVFGKGIPTSHFIMLKKSLEGAKALLWVSFGWTKSDVYAGKLKEPESWDLLYGKGDFLAWPIDYVANK